MFSKKSRSTTALLFSSLILTIGRGATLPFMAIYLSRQYKLPVDDIGIAMSISLTTGIVFSLAFGMLADKFEKKRYMAFSIITFIIAFAAIPMVNSTILVVIFFSIINCSYLVFSTVLKAYFSETLSISAKPKIFSLNYTFINIGWTVGPPIGTLLLMYGTQLPFWLAAISASIPLFMIQCFVQRSVVDHSTEENSVKWDPKSFETLQLDNLWCGYFADNVNSKRVQEKCGFKYHHIIKDQYVEYLDEIRTEVICRLTKSEWQKQQ